MRFFAVAVVFALLAPCSLAHAQGNTFGVTSDVPGETQRAGDVTRVVTSTDGFAIGCSQPSAASCTPGNSLFFFDKNGNMHMSEEGAGIATTPDPVVGSGIALGEPGNNGTSTWTLKVANSTDFPSNLVCELDATGDWSGDCPGAVTGHTPTVLFCTGSLVHNFGAVASWGTATVSVTCTGAAEGMMVDVGISSQGGATNPGYLFLFGHVPTGGGAVLVSVMNTHSSSNTLGSGTISVRAYNN